VTFKILGAIYCPRCQKETGALVPSNFGDYQVCIRCHNEQASGEDERDEMPKAYIDKLINLPIRIGHERITTSRFGSGGMVILCAKHGHHRGAALLSHGTKHIVCRICVMEDCTVGEAEERKEIVIA
jgi:hypothetical protein